MKYRTAAAALTLVLAMGGVAAAQTPIDESLDARSARRLDNLEKKWSARCGPSSSRGVRTGAAVVVQPAETQGQINSMSDKLSDLDHTLTRMNGELEVVRHDLDQIRADNNDLRSRDAALKEEVSALEQRVQGLTAPPPPPPPEAAAAPPPPSDDPAAAFTAAKSRWQSGDNAGAEAAFHDFTDRFGDSPRGPEARYYLGKTLAARKAWPEAATADIGAVRGWPQTRWAPDAVLDLSRALAVMGKTADACQTLGELARRYPKLTPAVASGARTLREQAACK